MSVKYNTSIVTDNLSLHLDATNVKSYPGSGTNWYDLSKNKLIFAKQGTTQTPYGTVGGASSFSFNSSGYWESTANHSLVDLGGDCTVILWLYEVGHSTRKTVFEKAGTSYGSYQQELAMTWEVAQDISYYSRYSPGYDYAGTPTCTTNAWNMMAIKMSTGRTTSARTGFYSKNGAAWTASYSSQSNTALVSAGAIRVGTGYAGTCDNGSVGAVLCYNKMLSDEEIFQNYNAMRGRFGL